MPGDGEVDSLTSDACGLIRPRDRSGRPLLSDSDA
jgi:hypothetical protein